MTTPDLSIVISPSDFAITDQTAIDINNCAQKIGKLLYDNMEFFTHVRDYTIKLLSISNKPLSDCNSKFKTWLVHEETKLKLIDKCNKQKVNELITAFKNGFSLCTNEEQFSKLRGTIIESFVACHYNKDFGFPNSPYSINYGVKLVCDNNVIYIPYLKDGAIHHCQSFDVILSCISFIDCMEIKIRPEGFQLKNLQLFEKISDVFDNKKIDNKLYFYTWGNKQSLEDEINHLLSNENIHNKALSIISLVNTDIFQINKKNRPA